MRTTDYEALAAHYDAPWRTNIKPDCILADRIARTTAHPFRVLDVGCGTGAWLLSQATAFAGAPASFFGVEPSASMLAVARGKNIPGDLRHAGAEHIPHPDAFFDFIITRYAYHHYRDKAKAFDEIVRVLKPGGTFVLFDMAPERMQDWLVYQFFPEAYALDLERFLPLDVLQTELERRSCSVTLEMARSEQKIDWKYVLGFCQGRGTSSLQILTEGEFQAGLQRIRDGMAADPDRVIIDGGYGGNLVATKHG